MMAGAAAAADVVRGAMAGALAAAASVCGADWGAAVPTAASSVRDGLAAGVLEHAAVNVAKTTKTIGLMSDGIRHHGCLAKSGPEGPLLVS